MDHDIRIPDIEIIVGAAGNDVAVFCFYKRTDIHQGYEVISAVADKNSLPVVRALLRDTLTALDTSDWSTLDELHTDTAEETTEPPF